MPIVPWQRLREEGEKAFRLHEAGFPYHEVGTLMGVSETTAWRRAHWYADAISHSALYWRKGLRRSLDRMPMRYSGPHGTWWAHTHSPSPRPEWEGETPGQLLAEEYERHVARYPDYYESHPRLPVRFGYVPPEPEQDDGQQAA